MAEAPIPQANSPDSLPESLLPRSLLSGSLARASRSRPRTIPSLGGSGAASRYPSSKRGYFAANGRKARVERGSSRVDSIAVDSNANGIKRVNSRLRARDRRDGGGWRRMICSGDGLGGAWLAARGLARGWRQDATGATRPAWRPGRLRCRGALLPRQHGDAGAGTPAACV